MHSTSQWIFRKNVCLKRVFPGILASLVFLIFISSASFGLLDLSEFKSGRLLKALEVKIQSYYSKIKIVLFFYRSSLFRAQIFILFVINAKVLVT
jgi:ABC-type multidrug transport system permease subunit